jgi:hypothetical protein
MPDKPEMQTVDPVAPLSATQERRLVDYLEDQFLELTRGYKKRLIPPNLSNFTP